VACSKGKRRDGKEESDVEERKMTTILGEGKTLSKVAESPNGFG
jgi:hypothetical protein